MGTKQAPADGPTCLPANVCVSWTAVPDAGYSVCLGQTNNGVCDRLWWPNGRATAKVYETLAPAQGESLTRKTVTFSRAAASGATGDVLVPGTTTATRRQTWWCGVGRTVWYVLGSQDDYVWPEAAQEVAWGLPGDVPVAGGDVDGDGRADYVLYRPATAQWLVQPSGGGSAWSVTFGAAGDVAVAPLVAPVGTGHPAQVVEYVHVHALGSVRAVTGELGTVLARHDFLPFGEEWTGVPSRETRLFTGQERDAATGLDYFGARYHFASIGRFTTVDPVYTRNDNLAEPQRWIRYAYAANNPLKFVDPDGKVIQWVVVALVAAYVLAAPSTANAPGPGAPIFDSGPGLLGPVAATVGVTSVGLLARAVVARLGLAAATASGTPSGSRALEYSTDLLDAFLQGS